MKYLLLILLIITGCKTNKRISSHSPTMENMIKCRNQWAYSDFSDTINMKVLLFNQGFCNCLQCFPNLIIGVTSKGDTIGVVDKEFERVIWNNELIRVVSSYWTENEKRYQRPAYIEYLDSLDIETFCKVRKVYFGRIVGYNPFHTSRRFLFNLRGNETVWADKTDSISNELNIKFRLTDSTTVYFKIMNMEGAIIKTLKSSLDIGYNNIPINVSDLSKGMYMIKVKDNNTLNYATTFKKK